MIIHIGFHKTGTTYLQRHIFTPENGYCSPWDVRSGEAIEHFVLTHDRKYRNDLVRNKFTEACKSKKCGGVGSIPVISHEDLCGYPVYSRYYGHQVAQRIYDTFSDAKILICIREQKNMIRSLYGQYVRQDGELSLPDFLGKGLEKPGFRPIFHLEHYEYDLMVNHYQELFGKEKVLVLPYEFLKNDLNSFEKTIHKFSGSSAIPVGNPSRENIGYGAKALQINRLLNYISKKPFLSQGDYSSLPALYRAKNKICRILNDVIPDSVHVKEEKKLLNTIDSFVGEYYKESNLRLSKIIKIDLKKYQYDL